MKISVIIPLYNKEKTVGRAIESVLAQTHSNLELIVVDDGSSDSGKEIVTSFKDPRISLICQTNKGVSLARNIGVAHASSDWIAFLDADDVYEGNFISFCVDVIEENCERPISVIASNYWIISGNKKKLYYNVVTVKKYDRLNYFKMCSGNATPVTSSSVIVNKNLFNVSGRFPTGIRYFEDWILWMKLAWYGDFYFLYAPLSNYYRDCSGVSYDNNIDVNELFRCASIVVEVSDAGLRSNSLQTDLARSTHKYINRFIVCESRTLSRKGYIGLALKLLAKVNVRYLASVFSIDLVYVFGYVFRSFIKKLKF